MKSVFLQLFQLLVSGAMVVHTDSRFKDNLGVIAAKYNSTFVRPVPGKTDLIFGL